MDPLNTAFREETRQLSVHRTRLGSALSVVIFSCFGLLDYFVYPEKLPLFLGLRGINALVALGALALTYRDFGQKYPTFLGAINYLSLGFIVSVMVFVTGGHASIYYTGLIVITVGVCAILPWGPKQSIPLCAAVYFAYILPLVLFDTIAEPRLFINANFFYVCAIFMTVIGTYFMNSLRFKEFKSRYDLEQAYAELKEVDEFKSRFFSNISHEFRTPLTLILAPVETLLEGKAGRLPPPAEKETEVIYHNALRLLKLIDDLLDMSRLDADRMGLSLKKGDMVRFIREMIASMEPIAGKKQVKLCFSGAGDALVFCFDHDKMEKVLLNLIANAIHFTDQGEIEVRAEKQDNEAVITIRDTGIGIKEKDLSTMFDRFIQAGGSAERRQGGVGIGLALSRDLVELHQGKIRIESKEGIGTTLTVTLPMHMSEDALPEAPEAIDKGDDWLRAIHKKAQYAGQGMSGRMEDGKALIRPSESPGARHTVLVVEDEPDMLQMILDTLRGSFRVIGARDGKEGLEQAKAHLPDLIISDIMMQGMSGYDLLMRLREMHALRNIPVIFLTVVAGSDMKINGLVLGADDYLVKPFNARELLARARNLIMLREMQRAVYLEAKLASIGHLAAGVAHEIINPLSSARSNVRNMKRALMKQGDMNEDYEEILTRARDLLDRIDAIVKGLGIFSRQGGEDYGPADIHEGLDATLSVLGHELKKGIKVHKQYCGNGLIQGNPGELNQVFLNIILNSCQSIQGRREQKGGNIRLATERTESAFVVTVGDDGQGMEKADLHRMYEPFFTTREVGQGTGLGMWISYHLVKKHGGDITARSEAGKGTEIVLSFPLHAKHLAG